MKKIVYPIVVFFCMHYYTFAQVGIGTTNPQAQLDVTGGNVRFSDYGVGTITGTALYLLGVESDGDIVEAPLNDINQPGLQYYTWDIPVLPNPSNIDNKRTLGVSSTQGIYNGSLNDAARAAIAPDNNGYILHYRGTIKVNNTGTFNFNATANDGSRIYIDNVLVVENWFNQLQTTRSGSVTLAKGEHKIEFWYYDDTGARFMEFTWGANPDSYPVNSVINANQFFVK